MSVAEHVYDVPSNDELARLVGAATPHFALQVRDRIALLAAALPPDHELQPVLLGHMARLERLAREGEEGPGRDLDLPPRPALSGLAAEGPEAT